jgi:hypothetical protein
MCGYAYRAWLTRGSVGTVAVNSGIEHLIYWYGPSQGQGESRGQDLDSDIPYVFGKKFISLFM